MSESAVMGILILAFLTIFMYLLHKNDTSYTRILALYFICIPIGMLALANGDIPFTPYTQILFMLIQTLYFYEASANYRDLLKRKRGDY